MFTCDAAKLPVNAPKNMFTCDAAKLPVNAPKNRYVNIYACESYKNIIQINIK